MPHKHLWDLESRGGCVGVGVFFRPVFFHLIFCKEKIMCMISLFLLGFDGRFGVVNWPFFSLSVFLFSLSKGNP